MNILCIIIIIITTLDRTDKLDYYVRVFEWGEGGGEGNSNCSCPRVHRKMYQQQQYCIHYTERSFLEILCNIIFHISDSRVVLDAEFIADPALSAGG